MQWHGRPMSSSIGAVTPMFGSITFVSRRSPRPLKNICMLMRVQRNSGSGSGRRGYRSSDIHFSLRILHFFSIEKRCTSWACELISHQFPNLSIVAVILLYMHIIACSAEMNWGLIYAKNRGRHAIGGKNHLLAWEPRHWGCQGEGHGALF